jgi:antitoxin YefM
MDALTYNQAKENFTAIMSQVCENHTPMIITDDSQKPVVLILPGPKGTGILE